MKKFLSIPFFIFTVLLGTFWGYSFLNDPVEESNVSSIPWESQSEALYDILLNLNHDSITGTGQGYGAIWASDKFISTNFTLNRNWRFTKTGVRIDSFAVTGATYAGGFRDMTWAKGYWWGVANGTTIHKIDTATMTQVGVITTGHAGSRGLAWDPVRQGFWVSQFGSAITCYDTNGTAIAGANIPATHPGKHGLAYDNLTPGGPYLWVIEENGAATDKKLLKYSMTTLQKIDSTLINIPLTTGPQPGSLEVSNTIIPGKIVLYGMIQGTPERVYALEIGDDVPAGNTITVCRDGLNKSIPDNGGNANHLRDTIVVSGVPSGMEITRMMVTIDSLPHTWVGDIRIWIEKVGGPVDTVISRIGLGTGAFPGAGNSCNDFINTNLVDSAATLIQSIQDPAPGCGNSASQIPANGYFKPKDPLSGFTNDIDPNGTYIIHISDNAAADVGSLRSWCLTIDYDMLTNAGNNNSIVNRYQLHQNYPNPFNPTTKIKFEIPQQNFVSLKIYDISGREVANLINGERNAGAYDVEFDGSYLASGTYFYRLQAGDFVEVKKMVLLK